MQSFRSYIVCGFAFPSVSLGALNIGVGRFRILGGQGSEYWGGGGGGGGGKGGQIPSRHMTS